MVKPSDSASPAAAVPGAVIPASGARGLARRLVPDIARRWPARFTRSGRAHGTEPGDPVDDYLVRLRRELHGCSRARADMLREARHGLTDAAEAYRERGAGEREAAEMAVAEFGPVAEVAPGYQLELAAGATRRALLFLALLVPLGNIGAWLAWRDSPAFVHRPPQAAFVLANAVDLLAWVTMGLALAGALFVTVGARWLPFRPSYAITAAVAIFTLLGLTVVSGAALSVLFAFARGISPLKMAGEMPGLMYLVLWSVLVWCGVRCVRTGRRAAALSEAVPA